MAFSKAKDHSLSEIFIKASSFCSYQERTQQEVREKLYGQNVDKDEIEEVIVKLIQENFINEERFARTYAGGKFRIKRWGRLKIIQSLKQKGLSAYCIKKGIEEIQDRDYENSIMYLIEKKEKEEKERNPFKRKDRISKFIIRKGYEPELVWDILNRIYKK
jgi:regulatory protein